MATRPGAARLMAAGAALLIGCGGSATSPTPPSALTGTWSGEQPFVFTAIYVGTNDTSGSGCGGSLRVEAQGAVLNGNYQVSSCS